MDVVNNTKKLIEFLMENYIVNVEVAVDMTVGNGNDSLLIQKILKPYKHYAFDIQEVSIKNSKQFLNGYNIEYILDTHENVDKYVKENIDFVIYNLGYLPKGDKKITTNAVEVENSLVKILSKIKKNGVILITFYVGHLCGQIESGQLSQYIKKLNQKEFTVLQFDFKNQINNPPYVVMIQKI